MKWILIQIICMTIIGTLILLIRKSMGKKLYPWVSTLLWVLFFVSAFLPMNIVKDLQVYSEPGPEQYIYKLQAVPWTEPQPIDSSRDLLAEREIEIQIDQVIQTVWLIGVIGVLLYKCILWFVLQGRLKNLDVIFEINDLENRATDGIYERVLDLKKEYNIASRLVVTKDFGPAVYGLKSKIYIPQALCEDAEGLRTIILHEWMHVKRRHSVIVLLSDVVSALYWFVPYVHFIFISALREDMEHRCDYEVMRRYRVSAKEYAIHYVNAVETKHLASNELAFRKGALKERVDYILKRRGSKTRSIIVSSSALVLLVGSLVGINAYYQMPNKNGHSRAEIEAAMEVVREYALAHEEGDAEKIQELRVEKYTPESLEYNANYSRFTLHNLHYDEKVSSYSRTRGYLEQHGLEYSNLIWLSSMVTISNKSETHEMIEWVWILYRADMEAPWKIYDCGVW